MFKLFAQIHAQRQRCLDRLALWLRTAPCVRVTRADRCGKAGNTGLILVLLILPHPPVPKARLIPKSGFNSVYSGSPIHVTVSLKATCANIRLRRRHRRQPKLCVWWERHLLKGRRIDGRLESRQRISMHFSQFVSANALQIFAPYVYDFRRQWG